jgi:hypothetical protein
MRRNERLGEDELRGLMARYQRGDSDAVEELVRSLSPLLWRYFTSPHTSRSDTEDLLGFEFTVLDTPIGQQTRSCRGSSQLPGTRDSTATGEGGGANPERP